MPIIDEQYRVTVYTGDNYTGNIAFFGAGHPKFMGLKEFKGIKIPE